MKYLRLPLFVLVCAIGTAHAQDERTPPPPQIPDFTNLDDFIYEPKSTVSVGVRLLTGATTSFEGGGQIATPTNPGPETGDDVSRSYRDGSVLPDARTAPIGGSGNPVSDPTGGGSVDPIADDDRTNSWNYTDADQLTEMDGFVAFHSYSAKIDDPTRRERDAKAIPGLELLGAYDMGKVFGTRMSWSITAGLSLNDIQANTTGGVRADVTTLTDFYFLFGQTPPEPPYRSPSTGTETLPNGGVISTDTSVLISDQPVSRQQTTLTDSTTVTNRWKVKGSYFTFRAGPTVWIPITPRFRASVSLGAALVYAGTNYSVTSSFEPDEGTPITEFIASDATKLLPGFYVDASLQFDLTERTGFYAGAVYQSNGTYTQAVQTANASYSTDIDLESQSGLRAGMTIRF